MKLNIAICDDEKTQIENIKKLVCLWADEFKIHVNTKEFESAKSFLFEFDDNKSFDIILLDIEMGELNGVELAKMIRRKSETMQIVFVTGYSDYIAEGYEVSALHYLMKPVNKDKFFATLNRAVEKIKKNEKSIFLETSMGIVKIPLYEIRYIEVIKNYVTVHAKEEHTSKLTLAEIKEKLDNSFFKTGRSYIINLAYVRRVGKKEVFLSCGSVIPLPRGMYENLNRAIIDGGA